MLVYLYHQHIIPVCEASVPFYEKGEYLNLFVQVLTIGVQGAYFWLIIFYLVFHCFTNFFAEVTRFADRRFYDDWWNAGDLAEYWRKWNHPIHHWLVRHIYFPLVRRKFSPDIAKLLTFLFSAIAHEYVAVGTFRVFNCVSFMIMMIDIPLISL
jgi:diacylglycerol O-acyltransferase-1